MLAAVGIAFLLGIQAQPPASKGFIPTSDAVDVARVVARGLGYSLADHTKYYFDLIPGEKGAPLFPGYVTIGFYWNSNTVNAISINEDTGQVLDRSLCTLFDYPGIRKFEHDVRRGSGVPPLTEKELLRQTGCDWLKRLSIPKIKP